MTPSLWFLVSLGFKLFIPFFKELERADTPSLSSLESRVLGHANQVLPVEDHTQYSERGGQLEDAKGNGIDGLGGRCSMSHGRGANVSFLPACSPHVTWLSSQLLGLSWMLPIS